MKWNLIKQFLIRHGVKLTAFLAAVGVSFTAGSLYKTMGTFHPGTAKSRGFRENEIIFPGKDQKQQSDQNGSSNDLWKQEEEVHENRAPSDSGNSSQLFEDSRVVDDLTQAENLVAEQPQQPDANTENTPPSNPNPAAPSVEVVAPAAPGTAPTNSNQPSSTPHLPGVPASPSASGNVPGNSTVPSGTQNSTTNPSNSATPTTPSVTPLPSNSRPTEPTRPTPTPAPTPAVNPTPSDPDLDEKPAQHPIKGTAIWAGNTSLDVIRDPMRDFPTDGLTTALETEQPQFFVSLPSAVDGDRYQSFYRGETLSYWKVLYAYNVTVRVNGQTYAFTDENENLQIDYPSVVEPDENGEITLTFRFRLNPQQPWEETSIKAQVYDEKIIFADENGAALWTQYLNKGELLSFFDNSSRLEEYNLISYAEEGSDTLTRIFHGWRESKDGPVLTETTHTCTENGVRRFYSAGSEDVPEGMEVIADSNFIDLPNGDYILETRQVVTSIEESSDALTIPEGIHAVRTTISTDDLTLPSTLQEFSAATLRVQDAIRFSAENPYFTTVDDQLLLSKDEETLYLAVENPEHLTLPETVTAVDADFHANSDQTLHILAQEPIEFGFNDAIGDGVIEVPDAAYYDYLTKWEPSDEHFFQIVPEHPEQFETVYLANDGAVMDVTESGAVRLLRIPLKAGATYLISNETQLLGDHLLRYADRVQTLIVPDSVESIGDDALTGGALSEVRLLHTEALPEISPAAFDADATPPIVVSKELYPLANETLPDNLHDYVLESDITLAFAEDGSSYSITQNDDGVATLTLYQVPQNTTEWIFDESKLPADLPEGAVFNEIGMRAFADCTDLKLVVLPDTITSIGTQAFDGCLSLEGVVTETDMETADQVTVGTDAFLGCTSLRFVVFNTWAQFDDPDNASIPVANTSGIDAGIYGLYLPLDLQEMIDVDEIGYETAHAWSNHYTLVPQGDGYLLYAEESGVLAAATTNISGEITLLDGTDQIGPAAFADCAEAFSFDPESAQQLIYISNMAFLSSGFTGNCGTDGYLELGETLAHIEPLAFAGCGNLTDVTITMAEMDDWSEDAYGRTVLPYATFLSCINLANVTFTDMTSVAVIEQAAFTDTALTEITLPPTISEIQNCAFGDGLMTINLTGDVPPLLSTNAPFMEFYWKNCFTSYGEPYGDNAVTLLRNGEFVDDPSEVQAYLDQWRFNLHGFYADGFAYETELDCMRQAYGTNDDSDFTNLLVQYENEVRDMFGLPDLPPSELTEQNNPVNSDDPANDIDIEDPDAAPDVEDTPEVEENPDEELVDPEEEPDFESNDEWDDFEYDSEEFLTEP